MSFQSFALAEPLAPTFRFYWAIVNLSPRPVFFGTPPDELKMANTSGVIFKFFVLHPV